ncbi:HAUS augmin-like complex subunit 3 [Uloborus diversus]|uniref:HAUS augmin-like complex subunit 3 n=1 Tax=Uloborus diversus TaxID=327109 RepID=UPI00240A3C14|nr:HAUS augmin-like complex subunit 3 [Uloborus diversus]
MSKGELFLDAVKRIGFPGAQQYEASDFDPFFSKAELLPLLDCFCLLNESNFLTTEEVCEYNSLSSADLEKINILDQSCALDELENVEHQKREIEMLEKQLALIEKQNAALEKQKNTFKAHELKAYEDKDKAEKLLIRAKRKLQRMDYSVAEAEKKVSETIASISEAIKEFEAQLTNDSAKNNLPTSINFKDQVEQLLQIEKKIASHVETYIQNNFQAEKECNNLVASDSELQKELKEIFFFKQRLQGSELEKIRVMASLEKSQAALNFFDKFEKDENYFNCFKSASNVRKQLEEATELNKKHQQKEKELYSYLSEATSDRVNACCFESALERSEETLLQFRHQKEKISLPAKMLYDQRLRLELLMFNMSLYYNNLFDLKDHIESSADWLESETASLCERKEKYDEMMKIEDPEMHDYLTENPVLISLYKMLVNADDLELLNDSHPALPDILKQLKKLEDKKIKLSKLEEEFQLQVESVEKYSWSIDKFFSGEHKEHPEFCDLDGSINVELNSLSLRVMSLESKMSEFQQQFNQKKKLLERKKNLALKRKLFAYALTNRELFEKTMKEIKVAMEKNMKHT